MNHRVLKNWEFHNDSIFSLGVSEGFTKIVTGGKNGEIFVTDLTKGAYTKVDNVGEHVTSVALKTTGDFTILASTSGNKIHEYVKNINSSPFVRNLIHPKRSRIGLLRRK